MLKRFTQSIAACAIITVLSPIVKADLVTAYQAYQEKDYSLAAEHFLQSAKLGHAKAQSVMAQLYLHGAGVEKDMLKSYLFYQLANSNQPSSELARNAKAVFAHLSEQQKQQATKALEDYQSKWGKQALQDSIFPVIADKPFVLRPGKRLTGSRQVSGSVFAVKRTTLSSAIVEFDVAPDGSVRDVAVLYNYYGNKSSLRDMVKESYQNKHKKINKPLHQAHFIERQRNTWAQTTVTFEYLKEESPKIYRHIRQLQSHVEEGKADAQYQLAMYILAFPALQTSKREGFELIKAAAEAGHIKAATEYARFLILGKYTKRDIDAGIDYLVKAAKSGESRAQYRLGRELLAGQIVNKDLGKARFWLQHASSNGNENAKYWLARALLDQDEVLSDDLTLANELLEEVAINHEFNPTWYYYRAKLLVKQGQAQPAADVLEKAISKASDLEWDISDWRTELNTIKASNQYTG